MYNALKQKVKILIPKKFLFKNELFFRYIHGTFYRGNKHQCNICNKKLNTFIILKNKDLLCPFCGSMSRTRRLWRLLNENKSIQGKILHFSPSRSLFRKLKSNSAITYFSSDFENEFLADYHFDIANINQPNETFDLIICYHILEHIFDDVKALKELYRVLKPKGLAYIQTPFKTGKIYEDYSITTPKLREKHFGQEDHVRIYSVKELCKRLENTGFKVTIKSFETDGNDFYNGFKSPETILEITK